MNPLLDPGARPVIGHRGNCAYAPENTLESFAQAVAAGADAIEFDVRISADGVPVVCHDPSVSRTTSGSGRVSQMTLVALRELDAGARFTADGGRTFPYRAKGIRIPSLDEVLERFPNIPLLIEVKEAEAAPAVRSAIEARGAEGRCLIDALDERALRPFLSSSIPTGAARAGVARMMTRIVLKRDAPTLDHRVVCIPLNYNGFPLPVRRLARVARLHDCRVHVWTINDPGTALDLWRAGVNGIITDDPALMLRTKARSAEWRPGTSAGAP